MKEKEVERIQKALEAELEKLIDAFGYGKQLTVEYEPHENIKHFLGEDAIISGECDVEANVLRIWRTGGLKPAIQTLVHEYFEGFLEPLYGTHTDAYNTIVPAIMKAYGEAFSRVAYRSKEKLINTMVAFWMKTKKEEK